MITLFYTQFRTPITAEKWAFYYQELPFDIRERIQRYRKEENKYQLLLGRMLLKKGMQELKVANFRLADMQYDEFSCPKWSQQPNFNIAHSANVVGCAFATNYPVGLDIEQVRPIDLSNFAYILNTLDKKNIKAASDPYAAFFKIWTIKEAVTKAIGKGLAMDVQQIFIEEKFAIFDKTQWYYQTLNLAENVAACIVTNSPTLDITIHQCDF
ncbi:MAG: 4'-phosphopantetheinyl transferase superfamily protein [Bacteroidota bacterium]